MDGKNKQKLLFITSPELSHLTKPSLKLFARLVLLSGFPESSKPSSPEQELTSKLVQLIFLNYISCHNERDISLESVASGFT